MRIVHLATTLAAEAGGLSRAILDSAIALASIAIQVDLISFENTARDLPWPNTPPANLTLSLLPSSSRFSSSALPGVLEKKLPGASALHLHGMWEPVSASAAKIARRLLVPYVCSIHGMLDPWSVSQKRAKKWLYFQCVERRRLSHADALHFTAPEEARKAAPWIPKNVPQLIIPVIMDFAPYRNLPDRSAAHALFPTIPPDAPWILFLSRIHQKKGVDLLIESLPLVHHKNAQLVIAGAGTPEYLQQLKAQIAALNIQSRTHFVGLVKGAAKTALYRRADMLVLPSSQENFGLVFPESLACQTPVLLTQNVDIHNEILNANAGLLIRRDPHDIASKINTLLADPPLARQLGQSGRQWVLTALDPTAIAKQWQSAYANLATRP